MNIPTYTNPKDPNSDDKLNFIIPLSDKNVPDEQVDEEDNYSELSVDYYFDDDGYLETY